MTLNDTFFKKPSELHMISRRFIEELNTSVEEVTYKRGQTWLGAGQVCRELAFLQKGSVASSRENKGTECITMLWNEGDILLSAYSFFNQKPALETTWFLSDASISKLPERTIKALLAKYDDMQVIISSILSDALVRVEEHAFMLTHHSPQEKLAYALQEYRPAFNLLTRDQQASFLNITRRTLSDLI